MSAPMLTARVELVVQEHTAMHLFGPIRDGELAHRTAIERWENEGDQVLAVEAGANAPPRPGSPRNTDIERRFMAAGPAFRTRIDRPADGREKLIALLNQQLADTFDLYEQAKQAQWNVKGPQFHQLHELFDDLADRARGHVDLIVERATAPGERRWARSAWPPGPPD